MAKSSAKKVDIFEVMKNLERGNLDVWSQLTDDEKKAISPFMLLEWLTSTDDPRQIVLHNEFTNKYLFSLDQHPELLLKIMAVCTSRYQHRYKWKKKKKKAGSRSLSVEVISEHQGINKRRAREALNIFDQNDVIEMATSLGYQKDDLKKIKNEWK